MAKFYQSVLLLCSLLETANTFGEVHLNSLAVERRFGSEVFIAALYSEQPSLSPSGLLDNNRQRRMELKVTTERLSAQQLNNLWMQGIAVNGSKNQLEKHADNMVKFSQLLKNLCLQVMYSQSTPEIRSAPKQSGRSEPSLPEKTVAAAPKKQKPPATATKLQTEANAPEPEPEGFDAEIQARKMSAKLRYHSQIWRRIHRFIEYPTRTQKLGQEGFLKVAVLITRNGQIKSMEFVDETDFSLLNKAVMRATQKASPFPACLKAMNLFLKCHFHFISIRDMHEITSVYGPNVIDTPIFLLNA